MRHRILVVAQDVTLRWPCQEDQARPIVYHLRFATCWQPRVNGLRMMVNSVFNGWRFEDIWLDK
jgi:peptide/nickel transport system substrate-binding protein